jgi:hypothetical protein
MAEYKPESIVEVQSSTTALPSSPTTIPSQGAIMSDSEDDEWQEF